MRIKIYVVLYHEDDPVKNTALKMVRSRIAKPVSKGEIRGNPVVLNPFSQEYYGAWLKEQVIRDGIVVVDASWKKLNDGKFRGIRGIHVRLPPLLPGNPINYSKPCILSSIEAVAAAIYIAGCSDLYMKLLGLYKWMATFHELNRDLLEEYSKAGSNEELIKTIVEYWGLEDPCYKDLK